MVVADAIFAAELRGSGAAGAELLVLLHALAGAALGSESGGASAVAFVLGFALARGRPRAFLAPLIALWVALRVWSGPLALGAAIPLLAIVTALLPVFRPVLPSGRRRVAAILALLVAVAGSGARAFMSAAGRKQVLVLMDSLFLMPFAARADALLAGWLAGRSTPSRIGVRDAVALVTAAVAANGGAAVAVGDGDDFICRAAREGAFLPLIALLVVAMDALPALQAPRTVRVLYATLVAASPARRELTATWCTKVKKHSVHKWWAKMVCVSPVPCGPEVPWWMAAVRRCTSPADLNSDRGVQPVIFIPLLIAFGVLFYLVAQEPMERALLNWSASNPDWPVNGEVVVSRGIEEIGLQGVEALPKRRNSRLERALRLIGYYAGMFFFFALFIRLALPASLYLSKTTRNPMFCTLPNALYNCDEPVGGAQRTGILQDASKTIWFNVFLTVSRMLSLLALPAMLFNVIAHIVFPRANWKRMHTLEFMLQNAEIGYTGQQQRAGPDFERDYEGILVSPVSENGESVDALDSEDASPSEQLQRTFGTTNTFPSDRLPLDLDFVLYIRYVTRGTSAGLVRRNCRHAVNVLRASGLPDAMWRVEVVTDCSIHLEREIRDASVYEIVVPTSYRPPNGALYKARALHYAIHNSPARDMDWIVHLDEETRFDTDTVTAMVEHCGRQLYAARVEKSEKFPRIGQGPIVYGRAMMQSLRGDGDPSRNWLMTLADSGRVSDDCGRYRAQYECGEVWVGMHGSYVVAPNCLERLITFDHGVEGSIAEDAYFALLARAAGARFAWIDALMFEQSPFSWRDFVKQRARWLVGGVLVVRSSRIPFRVRPVMATLSTLWSLMPVTYLALVLSVLLGSLEVIEARAHWFYSVLLPLSASVSMWSYFFGFVVTFASQQLGVVRFIVLLYLQMLLTPVFGVMEVSAVTYALLNFRKLSVGFHVVDKDASGTVGHGNLPLTINRRQTTETTRLLRGS